MFLPLALKYKDIQVDKTLCPRLMLGNKVSGAIYSTMDVFDNRRHSNNYIVHQVMTVERARDEVYVLQ